MKIIRPTAITDSAGSFTRSTTATYFDKDGILQTAAVNVPRVSFVYNNDTQNWKVSGVVLENTATNYILQSQTLNVSPWAGSCSVTSSGTMFGVTAWSIAKTTTGTSEAESQALGAAVVGEYYIATMALLANTATSAQIGLYGTTSLWANANSGVEVIMGPGSIAATTGSALATVSNLSATIPTYIKIYRKYTTTETASLNIYPGSASNNVIGTSIKVTIVQVERSTSAATNPSHTSYIPTTTVALPRAADIITGTGFIYSNLGEQYPAWVSGTTYAVGDRVTRSTTQLVYTRLIAGAGTTAPESDVVNWAPVEEHPIWVSGTTYSVGQRVTRATSTTHSVYERVVTGAGVTAPENDPINWVRVGPTNRWAVFDDSPSTLSSNEEYITYILKPGSINSLALLELDGTEVAINMYTVDGGILEQPYYAYNNLADNTGVGNWYEYFYEPFYYKTSIATTDMVNASLLDLPRYTNTILCVTIRKANSVASIGILATGIVYELGKTQNGMSVSIIDYSRKDTDTYGNTVLVRRKFSKRVSATFFLYSSKVDVVSNLLTQYRATPVVWIGADAQYSSLVIYGFYRDWTIGIPNNIGSTCNIEIEGLT